MADVVPIIHVNDQRAGKLADEITELYSSITAATYEFLVKVREFDYWGDEGGSLVFKGRLPAEVGAMPMKAIESGPEQVVKDVSAETRGSGFTNTSRYGYSSQYSGPTGSSQAMPRRRAFVNNGVS